MFRVGGKKGLLTRKRLKLVFAPLKLAFYGTKLFGGVICVDFDSGRWVRNAYMSLAMSLAISLATLWLRAGQNGQAAYQEDSYVS
jgi:hypothetical protein